MSLGICLLSYCNPKLITVSRSKDGFTGPSKLFAISLSDGLYVLIEYREEVIDPDSLENTIFVQVDAKYLGSVRSLGNEDTLNAVGPFSKCCQSSDKVAITEHSLLDIVWAYTSHK